MPKYPITLNVEPQGSSEKAKQEFARKAADAKILEDFLNEMVKRDGGKGSYNYGVIEQKMGFSKALLRDLLMPNGGGHHGITFD